MFCSDYAVRQMQNNWDRFGNTFPKKQQTMLHPQESTSSQPPPWKLQPHSAQPGLRGPGIGRVRSLRTLQTPHTHRHTPLCGWGNSDAFILLRGETPCARKQNCFTQECDVRCRDVNKYLVHRLLACEQRKGFELHRKWSVFSNRLLAFSATSLSV